MGTLSWIIPWAPYHKGPCKREAEKSVGDVTTAEGGVTRSLAWKMEAGVMSQGVQAVSRSWQRQGNGFPLESADTLIPVQ